MEQKNIMWIICDQFRFDALGCLGHPVVETPNLDMLAQEGALFSAAYSPCPSCIPARACLFTGLSPEQTGFLGYEDGHEWNFSGMLPEVLAYSGYQTHCVGKTHFFPQNKHCGFEGIDSYECWQRLTEWYVDDYEEWLREKTGGQLEERMTGLDDNSWNALPSALPEELHNNTWVVTKGLDFLRRRDRTRPYFLTLSFHRPHPPIDPPQRFWDIYQKKKCDAPHIGDWAYIHDKPADSLQAWEGRLPEEKLVRMRLGYYAQIGHIDSQIGRLLRSLRSRRDMPDVIIFTSDHGEMLGDHHLFRKTYAYQGSAAVPLIIWEKGKTCGKRVNVPVTLCDLYPTTMHYAGLPGRADGCGLDLTGLYQRGETIRREWIGGEHAACYSTGEAMQFLTDGKEKYIWFTVTGKEQFFDLQKDPYECHDLSGCREAQERLLVWRRRLTQQLSRRKDGLSDGSRLMTGALPAVREPLTVSNEEERKCQNSLF